MDTLGQRIRAARTLRGMEQRELARQAHLTIPYMSQIENDHVNPRATVVVRLAKILRVSTDYLLLGRGVRDLLGEGSDDESMAPATLAMAGT